MCLNLRSNNIVLDYLYHLKYCVFGDVIPINLLIILMTEIARYGEESREKSEEEGCEDFRYSFKKLRYVLRLKHDIIT